MKYISTYFTSFAIVLFSIATLNWFIDPFGMYWSPQVKGVNQVKTEAGKRSRITKAYQVHKVKPEILIVGNSRVEMGLNPKNKYFKGKAVYNQGMPGAGIGMQVDYAINAINNNDTIQDVVFGADFLDFLLSEKQVISFNDNKKPNNTTSYAFRLNLQKNNNNIVSIKEKMAMVFSLDALNASISTTLQQKAMVSSVSSNGFNNALSYIDIMNNEGIKPLFRQKLQEVSSRLSNKLWYVKAQEAYPYSPTFAHLGRLIERIKQKKIKLHLFINPYHYSYLYTLVDNDQWQNFKTWKYTLTLYMNKTLGDDFELWDFSGASSYINETVPLTIPKQQMKWFWEPAHYKKELGDLLIERLLVGKKSKHTDFGIKLQINNITSVLKKDEENLQSHLPHWKYLQENL